MRRTNELGRRGGYVFYPEAPHGVGGFRLTPVGGSIDPAAPLCGKGDSGAVWYDSTNSNGYGLHCAGEVQATQTEFGIAFYLTRVMQTLRVTLDPPNAP